MKLSRAAIAVATSALLTLTACGSSEPLAAGGSNGVAGAGAATPSALTEDNFVSTVIEAQLAAQSAKIDVSGNVGGQSLTLTGAVLAAEKPVRSALQADVEISGMGAVEVILVDAMVYLKLGELTGDKYLKLPLAGGDVEQFLGQLEGQLNPAEFVRALEGAVTRFEKTGVEDVEGEQTTRYVLQVDPRKVLAKQGVELPGGAHLPKALTYTFWMTPDNLPLRITADMGELGELDAAFSDWGEPVDIEAPAADQITDGNPFAPAA